MPIGHRLQTNRPRNDLDDYLDEVDSYLFCVTRADRRCLHNDLKAHARDLTIDESYAHQFKGKYDIDREQLILNLGNPKEIATMYISSVRKVPSKGMSLFLSFIVIGFVFYVYLGVSELDIISATSSTLTIWLNYGLIIGAAIGGVFIVAMMRRFEKYHVTIPYIIMIFLLLMLPISMAMADFIGESLNVRVADESFTFYTWLFFFDIIVLALIGLNITIKHIRVFQPVEKMMV
jgi:hypothetical protein